jgi:hypothetical protein
MTKLPSSRSSSAFVCRSSMRRRFAAATTPGSSRGSRTTRLPSPTTPAFPTRQVTGHRDFEWSVVWTCPTRTISRRALKRLHGCLGGSEPKPKLFRMLGWRVLELSAPECAGRALREGARRPRSADPLDPKPSRHSPQCEFASETDAAVLGILLKVADGAGGGLPEPNRRGCHSHSCANHRLPASMEPWRTPRPSSTTNGPTRR